jgi:hypothetical protein
MPYSSIQLDTAARSYIYSESIIDNQIDNRTVCFNKMLQMTIIKGKH